jgi:hypothetical protein
VEGHLEVWTASGRSLLELNAARCTIGSSGDNDIVIEDGSVSRAHLLFEQLARSMLTRGFTADECTRYFPNERCPTFSQ